MKVLKFGNISISTADKIKAVVEIIVQSGKSLVVVSAPDETDKALKDISDYLYKKNQEGAIEIINQLEQDYFALADELFPDTTYKTKATDTIKIHLANIRSLSSDLFTLFEERIVRAQGATLTTNLLHLLIEQQGLHVVTLSAIDFMRIDKNSEPDIVYIREKLNNLLTEYAGAEVFITQGYICRNAYGEIDNLRRGGSSYSAAIIGAAIHAEEIQIWTETDGIYNNDPRYVTKVKPIGQLNFDEAAELAYFEAQNALHPTCILPAKVANIPVKLLNTLQPEANGTLISNATVRNKVKAIAAKEGITAIQIKSGRMLLAHGFLRRLFEVFEEFETPIDMLATSEIGVSLTIDNTKHLDEIVNDLKKYGTVAVDTDMAIVSVIGDADWQSPGLVSSILGALKEVPIRMLSYGGSNFNFSFLVKLSDLKNTLHLLDIQIFQNN